MPIVGRQHYLPSKSLSVPAVLLGAGGLIAVLAIHLGGGALSDPQNQYLLSAIVLLQIGITFQSLRESLSIEGDIFAPRGFAQLIILAYSLVTPLLAIFDSSNRVLLGFFLAAHFSWDNVVGTSLLFLLMQSGVYLASRVSVRPLSIRKRGFTGAQLNRVSWALFSLALVYYGYTFKQIGGSANSYVDVFAQMQTENAQSSLLSYLSFFSLLPLCSIIAVSVKEKRYGSVGLLIVALSALTYGKPSRGIVFSAFILLALAYHYYIKKIRLRKLAVGAVALSILSIAMVGMRSKGGLGGVIDSHNELTFVGEGNIIYENTYMVFQNVVSADDYKYGSTYVDGFLFAVPSYVLPFDRGPSPMLWFRKTFFTSKEIEGPGGRMFSIVAEAFMNFGYFGPPIMGFLYGLFLNILYVSARASLRSQKLISVSVILYFYFVTQMYYFMRGDFSSFVIRTMSFVVLPLVFMVPIMRAMDRREGQSSPTYPRGVSLSQWS
jgi:oligosaccharide repeat unit polymerase